MLQIFPSSVWFWSFRWHVDYQSFKTMAYYWKLYFGEQVSEHTLKYIESTILGIKKSVPIFLTKMVPTYLFEVGIINAKIPLTALREATILCISAIGSAEPFVKQIQKVFLSNLSLCKWEIYFNDIIGDFNKFVLFYHFI